MKRKKLTTDELIEWCEKEAARNALMQGDKPNHSARRRNTFRHRNHMLRAVFIRFEKLELKNTALQAQLKAVINGIYADPHQWDMRPGCPTCQPLTKTLDEPFGCERLRNEGPQGAEF